MLRISEDEGEGDERPPPAGAGPNDAGQGAVDGAAATESQQQPSTTPQAPLVTQEGHKTTTLSLSEIKKAIMDISANTGTGENEFCRRRNSDPRTWTPTARYVAARGSGSGTGSCAGSGSGTPTGRTADPDIGAGTNNNESDLENDVFTDSSQGSACAPAIRVRLPVEYDMIGG
jgi:hypothetical protein